MANPLDQAWEAYSDSDNEKPLLGTVDATGYALAVYLSITPSGPPVTTIPTLTPTVATTTITMLISRANTNLLTGSAYSGGEWFWALRRLDSGSRKPLAAGTLVVNVEPTA